MRAFLYGVTLQWKLDLRNKEILIIYYLVPLVFFGFMGMIFTSINPEAKGSLIQSMSIFTITMGAFLGSPIPLVELYSKDFKKAYKVGGIPLWAGAVNNFISAFVHLFITELIIYGLAPVIYDAKIPERPMNYFILLAVFLMVCLSIGTVLGLYLKSTSKVTMISQLLFLPSIMLSGIMFPPEMLPKVLGIIGHVFPATLCRRLMIGEEQNLLLLIPQAVYFILAVVLSGYKLSKSDVE